MRLSTSSWDVNPRRTISRFVFHAEDQISPSCTLYLSALSSDLELWSCKHHPRVMYCTYYTIAAVGLGPGQLWDYHPLKAFQVIPVRDTSHSFMWYASLRLPFKNSPLAEGKQCTFAMFSIGKHAILSGHSKVISKKFQTFVKMQSLKTLYFLSYFSFESVILWFCLILYVFVPPTHFCLSQPEQWQMNLKCLYFLWIWKAQELMGIQETFFSIFDVWHKWK